MNLVSGIIEDLGRDIQLFKAFLTVGLCALVVIIPIVLCLYGYAGRR